MPYLPPKAAKREIALTVQGRRDIRERVGMKPYYEDSAVTIYHGDCRLILPQLPKVDLVFADPPYELGFMGKEWDKQGVSFRAETWRITKDSCNGSRNS